MVILGLILSIFVAVSAVVLLVTAEDDALARIVGSTMWCGVYSAMLMGW